MLARVLLRYRQPPSSSQLQGPAKGPFFCLSPARFPIVVAQPTPPLPMRRRPLANETAIRDPRCPRTPCARRRWRPRTTTGDRGPAGRTLLLVAGLVVAGLLLGACASDRVFVTSSLEDGARFHDYLDYRWLAGEELRAGAHPERHRALAEMVQAAVDLELSYKGYRRREQGRVDFFLSVQTDLEDVAVISSERYRGWSHGYNYRRMMSNRNVSRIEREPQGVLTIRIIDATSDRVVWRGSAAGLLGDARHRERRVQRVVERMLAQFPPPE